MVGSPSIVGSDNQLDATPNRSFPLAEYRSSLPGMAPRNRTKFHLHYSIFASRAAPIRRRGVVGAGKIGIDSLLERIPFR